MPVIAVDGLAYVWGEGLIRGKNWGGRERFYLFEKACSPNCLGIFGF